MRANLPRILAIVLAFVPAIAAFGQDELPEGLTSRTSLSPSEEQAVADWALALWANINAETPTAARDARRRLVEPLLREDTSASFRVAMDQALAESFREAQGDVFRSVNAYLLMGWLATDRTVRILTDAVEGDQIATRFAAASGLSNSFRAAGFAPVAFQAQVGNAAADTLAGVLSTSNDQHMLDASAKALIDALAMPESAIAGFSARAGERMTRAVGERMNTLPIDGQLGNRLNPLLRAMAEIRTAVTQRRGDVGASWQNAIMEMYGRAGALGFRYVRAERAGQIGGAEAERGRRTVENTIQVAGTISPLLRIDRAMQDRLAGFELAESFDRAEDGDGDEFQRSATSLIRLLDDEFNLPSDRFNIGG